MIFMYGFILFISYAIMKTTKDEKQKEEFKKFLFEKNLKKDKNIYVLPWIIFILFPILYIFSIFIIIFIVFFTPIYIYVKIYGPLGPNNIVGNFLNTIKWPLIFFLIFIIGFSWLDRPKNKIIKKLKRIEVYPVEKWIIKNIPCPYCSGKLNSCNYDIEKMKYECNCVNCNKKIIMVSDASGRHINVIQKK